MSDQDPNSSKDSSHESGESQQNPSAVTPPPLSSPEEPTRAHPSDPSRTYSSDPSQYATPPQQPTTEGPSKIYMTESTDTDRVTGERKSYQENRKEKEKKSSKMKSQNKIEDFYQYAGSDKGPTITYILLGLGLLTLLFLNSLLGELIIGMVAGYYFSSDIVYYIRNLGQMIGSLNQLRPVVLATTLFTLFLVAPGVFIGAVIVAIFKEVIAGPR